MPFKYAVGQAVEFTPIGEKKAGLFRITRRMPEEQQAADFRYRIKSAAEIHERNVLECHLNSVDEEADRRVRDREQSGENVHGAA